MTYEELKIAYEMAMQKCSELESQNAELVSEKAALKQAMGCNPMTAELMKMRAAGHIFAGKWLTVFRKEILRVRRRRLLP